MGNTLFDQLKKSGLIDEKKANKVKQEKHRQTKQQKGKRSKQQSKSQLLAQKAQAEKVARDRELNEQRKRVAEQKSVNAQIKQLIMKNRIEAGDGEIAFNFIDGKTVHRLYVTDRQQDQLARGRLAIVKLKNSYEVVPAEVAEKIKLRDPSYIIQCTTPSSTQSGGDDPYAEHPVPDDLMW